MGERCECARCKPGPGKDPDPDYGYDRNAVPDVDCLVCGEKIGREPYVENTLLARFGQMTFAHARCAKDWKRAKVKGEEEA